MALPITARGLRLDDEATAMRTALQCLSDWARLSVSLTQCQWGAQVDAYGVYNFVCKRASGKITRHQALNNIIARAFVAADMPVTKAPNGLSISDNKARVV